MVFAAVAGPVAVAPATAAPLADASGVKAPPVARPDAVVDDTVCTAERSGYSAATGSCENPASHLSFRVRIICQHWATGDLYQVVSPLVSTYETEHVFCGLIGYDVIRSWSATIVQTGEAPDPPDIDSLRCEYFGNQRFICGLSASGYSDIRWTYNGFARPAWDDDTTTGMSRCNGGYPTVRVYVSNSEGTSTASDTFRCEGPPL